MSTEKSKRTRANGEGTIFKHRNRWVVSCYDIQKVRRTTSFKKKVEAEDWLSAQRDARKRMQGTYVPKPNRAVGACGSEMLMVLLYACRLALSGSGAALVRIVVIFRDVLGCLLVVKE